MRDLRLRMPLAAAAACLSLAALPAVAGATPVAVENGAANTLTVTGDGTDEAITLTVSGGQFALNGTVVTGGLPADGSVAISVDGGAGNDNIDASGLGIANYASLTITGNDGNDVILGGGGADTVSGGNGNDRVDGGKGADQQNGDAGNDTLVWNQGEGSDTNDGGLGNDTVEVNGNPTNTDNMTVTSPVPGHVLVTRVAPGPFTVDSQAVEKVALNGLGGDDVLAGSNGLAHNPDGSGLLTLGLAIDGGAGNDTITGGDTNDTLLGGEDSDTISGGAGDDMIAGGHGADTMNGGAGDDVMSWSNGDGSDVTNGDVGFDTTQVIEGAANDVNTVAPNGARTMFSRTSAAAFTMDMDTEALDLESLAGNDSLTVSPGVTQVVVANGGDGNDTFTGGDENDTFFGGAGDDALTGGAGSDVLDGGDGNDTLTAHDEVADLVRGGAGEDSAFIDNKDAVDGVEHVTNTDLPPAPTTVTVPTPVPTPVKALAATVTTGTVKLVLSHKHWLAKLPVSCPAAEAGGCTTTVTLWTAKAVKLGGVTTSVALGSKKVSLKPGQKGSVTITLTGGAAKLFHKGKLAARAVVATVDGNGNGASASRSVSLVLPAKKK